MHKLSIKVLKFVIYNYKQNISQVKTEISERAGFNISLDTQIISETNLPRHSMAQKRQTREDT